MKNIRLMILAMGVLVLVFSGLWASPSSIFWTNCTTDVVATGSANFQVYNYFSVFNRRHHGEFFNPDIGLTGGVFTWKDVSCEAGIDYLGGADDPWYFNAKIGIPEDNLWNKAPSFSVGIFDLGTRYQGDLKTNYNVGDVVVGKTLPEFIGGRIFIGGYFGNKSIGKTRAGVMVAYQRGFCKTKDSNGKEYDKWQLVADYASGKTLIGGGGVGLAYYFTPDIYLETGPVFFNDANFNGYWKWTVQLNFLIQVFKPCT